MTFWLSVIVGVCVLAGVGAFFLAFWPFLAFLFGALS